MNKLTNTEMAALIDKAVAGDKKALEEIIVSVQDLIFNLSLRMLGTFSDAEDATQDILLKIITHLSTFRKESSFSTWVFAIASNHLKNYKKHMFAKYPLSFEFYGEDIENAKIHDVPDMTQNVEREILAEELKLSCTNVMLQCLDAESRCIFILGTMFKLDSRMAGEILEMTPEAYRQRLSRARKKWRSFFKNIVENTDMANADVRIGLIMQFKITGLILKGWIFKMPIQSKWKQCCMLKTQWRILMICHRGFHFAEHMKRLKK